MVSSARGITPPNVTPFDPASRTDFLSREIPASTTQLEREMNIIYTPAMLSRPDPQNSNHG